MRLNTKPCVTVLGGGIRGTAIAALLAQSHSCKVILLEREHIGSGTTSSNQGRLHSGAGVWQTGLDALAYRHRTGSELIRQIPGVVEKQEHAIYLVHAREDIMSFETTWQRYSIPHRRVNPSILNNYWIQGDQFAAAYEVPEFSFNPARLAGKLAAYARSLGADIRTKSPVYAIEPGRNQTFRLRLRNEETINTDIIINAMGNWVNHIHSELPLPKLHIQWHQWSILCLFMPHRSHAAVLTRIISVLEKDRSPTAVPHDYWITFGCRLTPENLTSPSEAKVGKWRHLNQDNEMDNILFEEHAKYFLPLQSLTPREKLRRVFSFSGIYPAFEKHRENPFRILQSDKVPNYYVVYGENATTALLDAVDALQVVLSQLDPTYIHSPDYALQCIKKLGANSIQDIYPHCSRMVWENMIDSAAFESSVHKVAT